MRVRPDDVGATQYRRSYVRGVVVIAGVWVLLALGRALSVLGTDLLQVVLLGLLVGAIWLRGPEVGFDRRAGLLIGVPLIGAFVLFPAVWRWASGRRWLPGEPLEPAWSDRAWRIGIWIGSIVLTLFVVGTFVQAALHP